MSIEHVLLNCGITVQRYEPVYGGDINRSYCLHTAEGKFFLKVNDATLYPGMFAKEASGLSALHGAAALAVPRVIKYGVAEKDQYLLLEWIEKGTARLGCWRQFGTGLAMLHKKQQARFGWSEDNFIGSLVQLNRQFDAWHLFYTNCRVMPLVAMLFNRGSFLKNDVSAAEIFCKKIEQRFPTEPPALLHGDLWSGNYLVGAGGNAVIFDPAVHCGHREMDIGMTLLFGGFNNTFYDAYNEAYPLEKGWRQRLPLTQLYPVLVHAVLFGGHYINSARELMKT